MSIVARRRLPLGIQTFRKLREEDAYYVDKTPYISRLLGEGAHYFLSRPRRFGKSLFLDTLKELFEGSEELFEGLYVHDDWNWSVRHPVVRLSFGSASFKDPDHLDEDVVLQLEYLEEEAGIPPRQVNAASRLRRLLQALHRKTGRRVVVLVDEYDKPILDALEEPEAARANRDYLRGMYGVIKDCDAHVRFSFLTGVSKFSKVSVFSVLNNLTDITLEPAFSAICGYTESDLDTVFGPELDGLDRQQVREWYNGYGWLGEERVYNPYDVLLEPGAVDRRAAEVVALGEDGADRHPRGPAPAGRPRRGARHVRRSIATTSRSLTGVDWAAACSSACVRNGIRRSSMRPSSMSNNSPITLVLVIWFSAVANGNRNRRPRRGSRGQRWWARKS